MNIYFCCEEFEGTLIIVTLENYIIIIIIWFSQNNFSHMLISDL